MDEGTAAEPEWYVEGWEAYAAAVAEGAAVLEKSDATADEIANAISAITEAKEGLTARGAVYGRRTVCIPVETGQLIHT